LGKITINHPFHPLKGCTFEVIKIKKLNGIRYYSLKKDQGVFCIPETWTDRYPTFSSVESSPPILSPYLMRDLLVLTQSLDDFTND